MIPYLTVATNGKGAHPTIKDLPEKYTHYLISDIHFGSLEHHDAAFAAFLRKVKGRKNVFVSILGDLIEGQTTDHPHYDHLTIADHYPAFDPFLSDPGKYDFHTPDGQVELAEDLLEHIKPNLVCILKGNHDWRFDKVRPFINRTCRKLGVPYLGTQGHLRLGGVNYYLAHRGKMYTNQAHSPNQRRANMEESCRRHFTARSDYWGSAHAMFHGDTHQLLLARPVSGKPMLLTDGATHRMRVVKPGLGEGVTTDGFQFVPADARWCGVTGTFRRGDRVVPLDQGSRLLYDQPDDYGSKAAYPPLSVGYIKLDIAPVDGVSRIVDGSEVWA